MMQRGRLPACALAAVALAAAPLACQVFDSPPYPSIQGLDGGLLDDAKAPVVIDFSEPIEPKTLGLAIVPYAADLIDPDAAANAQQIFDHSQNFGDFGGKGTLEDGNRRYSIQPNAPLPIGPRLAVLVNAGLTDPDGVPINANRVLPFGFQANLSCPMPSSNFPSGDYFFLAEVTAPIATQVKLLASIRKDADSGAFIGQFTDAIRNRDAKCPMKCDVTEVCRLLPTPQCVAPSTPAGSVDEYSDFVPNPDLPTGFSFTATGCVVDDATGVTFTTAPADVAVSQPAVTLRNARLDAAFKMASGVLRASGSFSADSVILGTSPSGAASGSLTARGLTAKEAPAGIPEPPHDFDAGVSP